MSNRVIHCVLDFFAKPGSEEKVRTILLSVLERARKEDGCLKHKLFQNMADPCQFTFIGAWESEDALEDHLTSDQYRKADSDIKKDVTRPMDQKRYKYIQNDPSLVPDTKASGFCTLI